MNTACQLYEQKEEEKPERNERNLRSLYFMTAEEALNCSEHFNINTSLDVNTSKYT